jgi:acyl phosphate:glycerol-3-phosphate acyltransferase
MDVNAIIIMTGLCAAAYLLGAAPSGLILVKMTTRLDLRKVGSGNIGATNARRAGGWPIGIATLICDVLKGAIPVALAGWMMGPGPGGIIRDLWMAAVALCAFFGHLFPVYLKFKTGGKGVATAAGCFAVLSPAALGIAVAAFILVAGFSRRVSAGSLAAAAVLPMGVAWFEGPYLFFGCALLISVMVVQRHQANIRRLLMGLEPPLFP